MNKETCIVGSERNSPEVITAGKIRPELAL